MIPVGKQTLAHYPDAKGFFTFVLPEGQYALKTDDIGLVTVR